MPRPWLLALYDDTDAARQLEALRSVGDLADESALTAVFDVACRARSANVRARAMGHLATSDAATFRRTAARRNLQDESPRVRCAAAADLADDDLPLLLGVLQTDPKRTVRQAALVRLFRDPYAAALRREAFAIAATDPHWRVRATLVACATPHDVDESRSPTDPRTAGVHAMVLGRDPGPTPSTQDTLGWDADPAVEARMLLAGCALAPNELVEAALHAHASVRSAALRALVDDVAGLRAFLARDPRTEHHGDGLQWLGQRGAAPLPSPTRWTWTTDHGPLLDHERRARAVTRATAHDALATDPAPLVWQCAARALGRRPEQLLEVALPEVPRRRTRWRASLGQREQRPLGHTGLHVTPLGVSGHYGLSEDGFARAIEAGINTFFWEPNYAAQTRFLRQLAPALRTKIVLVAGTFEAAPERVRADLDRARRLMGVETLDLFLLFWVRSPRRLDDDVRGVLERARERGVLRAWGLSTHDRSLARAALAEGIDPLMIRLNCAHRGAEREVLPYAQGAGVLGFSNLLYGRLLSDDVPASLLYRYVLDLPGVTSTWSAPANREQLEHNLRALDRGPLTAEERARLHAHGDVIYEEGRRFRECIRYR